MDGVVYGISKVLMNTALKIFGELYVEGKENVPKSGPFIVVSNHLSNLDPALLMASLPRRVYFLAKKRLFVYPIVSSFFRAYGAFPVETNGRSFPALHWAKKRLAENRGMAIFPEAHRKPKGGIGSPLSGVSLLGRISQAPIVPVGITGSEHIGPFWRVAFPTGKYSVKIGEPFILPTIPNKKSDRSILDPGLRESFLDSSTDMIMGRIASLLPKQYRGIYDS